MTIDIYDEITTRVISQLDKGTVPWRIPFHTDRGLHRNLQSGRPYRGINQMLTAMSGYQSPYWTTFNGMKKAGGRLRDDVDRRGTTVTLWKRGVAKCKKGAPHTPDHGCRDGKVQYFILRYYMVWNVEQTTLPIPEIEPGDVIDPDIMGEAMVDGYLSRSGVTTTAKAGAAYYVPVQDLVNVPPRDDFKTMEGYYSTYLHELAHSTGHKDRLARPGIMERTVFGDDDYSDEELVAEMTAAMCMGILGLFDDDRLNQSAAYIDSWRSKLEGDNRLIVNAAARAQKAADFIIGKTWDDESHAEASSQAVTA